MDTFLNHSTYEQLKKDIMTFELLPGDTVSAAKVAKRYNVSRTPAREALVRLETEGLVDIIPQSKSVISKISISVAKEEWFIRRTLELGMTDTLFSKITKKEIDRMRKLNNEMTKLSKEKSTHENSYKYLMADNEFHSVIYEVCGQFLAKSVIASNMAHYSRLRFLTESEDAYKERTLSGHGELIKLLEAKDIDGYTNALSKHLDYIIGDINELKEKHPGLFKD